jgi:membrane fusion protein, heavy metal efflux system
MGRIIALLGALRMAWPGPLAVAEEDHGRGHEEESGVIRLNREAIAGSGLSLKTAGRQKIAERLVLNGRLLSNDDRTVHVVPRFSGVIREAYKHVGDQVKKDEMLAVVESNQSLQKYEIRSPLDGTVTKRHASIGEFVAEGEALFLVTDLSSLWADLFLFPGDFGRVKKGQRVVIRLEHRSQPVLSAVTMVSSVVDEATQSKIVRAEINNAGEDLYPGQFLTGAILLSEEEVPVAVEAGAIRKLDGKSTLFVPRADVIEPREVALGRTDEHFSEIVSGLKAGEQYYAGNTFILKAEAEKGKAVHEH